MSHDEYIVVMVAWDDTIVITRVVAPTFGDALARASGHEVGYKWATTVKYSDLKVVGTITSPVSKEARMAGFFRWLFGGGTEETRTSYELGYEAGKTYAEQQIKGLGSLEKTETAMEEYAKVSGMMDLVADRFYAGWYKGYEENQ